MASRAKTNEHDQFHSFLLFPKYIFFQPKFVLFFLLKQYIGYDTLEKAVDGLSQILYN